MTYTKSVRCQVEPALRIFTRRLEESTSITSRPVTDVPSLVLISHHPFAFLAQAVSLVEDCYKARGILGSESRLENDVDAFSGARVDGPFGNVLLCG